MWVITLVRILALRSSSIRKDASLRSISETEVSAVATEAPLAVPTSGCAGFARASV
jgi:hypothetical protein